jgi:uracil-DNA glycosylase family 4
MNSITTLENPTIPCNRCEEAIEPMWGIKGPGDVEVLIVLQSSDYRALEHPEGYVGAFLNSLTGRDIQKILQENWNNVALVNSIKCHFKKDNIYRDPRTTEYRNCTDHLQKQLKNLNPSLVLCCGSWAIRGVFGEEYYDNLKPDRYSVQFTESDKRTYAITTHPRLFTCPIKDELAEIIQDFREDSTLKQGNTIDGGIPWNKLTYIQ